MLPGKQKSKSTSLLSSSEEKIKSPGLNTSSKPDYYKLPKENKNGKSYTPMDSNYSTRKSSSAENKMKDEAVSATIPDKENTIWEQLTNNKLKDHKKPEPINNKHESTDQQNTSSKLHLEIDTEIRKP